METSPLNPASLDRGNNAFIAWRGWDRHWLRLLAVSSALIVLFLVITVPLSLNAQALLGVFTFFLALWLNRYGGRLITLFLVFLSVTISSRYIYWRLTETLGFDSIGGLIIGTLLISAELYAFFVLLFGYFQSIWPLERKPAPLPADTRLWPSIDVFIPTYNEPLKVVRATMLAATNLDWPQDKLNIYVLDDGRRDEFRQYAESIGVHYLTRSDNTHAKAGNINRALHRTRGEFVVIFDADHLPTRSFLQTTIGWFLRDKRLGMLQTPHHFFSPDPFERNLRTFRRIPNEGELFYGLIQDGNDLWNSTFFCGSCAVLRRRPLMEVGGIAVETVTEDAHTALKMHRKGYNTAYIKLTQAAGLATESFSAHIGQRIRWARGLAQIFRIDNPFLGRGLRIAQRLCYANATLHYFYALPRLIFLTAPLGYLFFEAHIIEAQALMIAALALPHIAHAQLTNNRIQGKYRHSFWSEVYESALAYYILIPTLLALISPKLGKFNVTAKGGIVPQDYFDVRIAGPHLALLVLNLIGLALGFTRLYWWNPLETDTVILNIVWTSYNLLIIGATLAVAWETRQTREHHRITAALSGAVALADGHIYNGEVMDISEGGGAIRLAEQPTLDIGDELVLYLSTERHEEAFPVEVIACDNGLLRVRFSGLDANQERKLIYFLYSRADAWLDWHDQERSDRPIFALAEIALHSMRGLKSLFSFSVMPQALLFSLRSVWWLSLQAAKGLLALLLIGLSAALLFWAQGSFADEAPSPAREVTQFTFKELGAEGSLKLRGGYGGTSVPFFVRSDEVVYKARLSLDYRYPYTPLAADSKLQVRLNGEPLASLPLARNGSAEDAPKELALDPRLLKDFNRLTMHLRLPRSIDCEDVGTEAFWVSISNQSRLQLWTHHLPLGKDLSLLPLPFFDKQDIKTLDLPFVLPGAPSEGLLHASGVMAAWFGALASYRGARFPVMLGALPEQNAVVFATHQSRPRNIPLPPITGATIALHDHPEVPHAKLLLVLGRNPQELKLAVRTLIQETDALSGTVYHVDDANEVEPRAPYDAPRWVSTQHPVRFGELTTDEELRAGGAILDPIRVDFRAPPDLFGWRSNGVPLQLKYQFSPSSTQDNASLNISFNQHFLTALSIAHAPWYRQFGFLANPDDNPTKQQKVMLPVARVGQQNRLLFHFASPLERASPCQRQGSEKIFRAKVDSDSSIDFSKFPHFTALPNISFFVNSGFPFSRFADLAETAVVLPEQLTAEALEVYLTLMGRFGNATGYPPYRMTLIQAHEVDAHANKDLLVFGTSDKQPLVTQWARWSPFSMVQGNTQAPKPGLWRMLKARWDGQDAWEEARRAKEAAKHAGRQLAVLTAFESPLADGRSVLMATAETAPGLKQITEAMLMPERLRQFQGDLTLVTEQRIAAFWLGPRYYVGALPWWTRVRWTLSRHAWALFLFLFVGSAVVATLSYRAIQHRATQRLQAHDP